ncbi:PilC/PilY family type IV pilus protein [Jeongeupia wiesaeckerbachi]|uniref:PilC/PilY family type IV pilus protein n=1 Tax=Jeongeupia wiesaeckerbachi TaxID=3051218 RepID=UPI003D808C05
MQFRLSTLRYGLALAFPALGHSALAAEPYPALPPTLSTSVIPNVLLHIDNSGSMKDAPDGKTVTSSNPSKMRVAKDVAKTLVTNNPNLRWGLFSFDTADNDQAGVLQAAIGSNQKTITDTIEGLSASTWTPLGETLFEITRYFGGQTSYYGKISGNYTSPIQYRCQKNFVIVVTDGVSTKDDQLPGLPKGSSSSYAAIDYVSYDSSSPPKKLTPKFSVCTKADSTTAETALGYCPASYTVTVTDSTTKVESQQNKTLAFKGTSDDSNSYGRSIIDVARYAYDADFRVVGTDSADKDADGKSFDDDKFKKQNFVTYTVGFAVDDPVLEVAARRGNGTYEKADDKDKLVAALNNAVANIVASISNAGGVATQSETVSAGNKVFQPVFNPNGWYGELRCYNLDSTGNFNPATSQCTPNGKAVIPVAANRTIYSSKVVSGQTTPFAFTPTAVDNDMTAAQKSQLDPTLIGQLIPNLGNSKNVVKFLRGETVTNYRTRNNGLLGDIVDSQPMVISKPNGYTSDSNYQTFITDNANRNMVFIGANDGMLHAFDIATMTEKMAYVPSSVYSHLPALTKPDYGLSGGTPHAFHVNGSMRWADVKVGTNWKTLLVGGLGQGGQGYFTVDATTANNFDPNNGGSASKTIKWEWTDQNSATMGYSFGTPLIYNVRTSADTVVSAVILSNGYESDYNDGTQSAKSSSLYVINADTGVLLKEIAVTGGAGLSSPAGVDFGQDGVLDYVYAGDSNGKLWRFDLTTNDPANFSVTSTPIFDAGPTHPIIMRPAVMAVDKADNTPLGNLILFGTGRLLTDTDRTDTTTQSLYGVVDVMDTIPTTVTRSDLQVQTIDATYAVTDTSKRVGTYRKMSTNAIDLRAANNSKLGWYIDLTNTERLVTSPMWYNDKVLFGTGITQSNEKCLPGGKGWIMGLNPLTGSVPTKNNTSDFSRAYSFVDVTPDRRSTAADKLGFSTGEAYASGYDKSGIPTELTYVGSDSKIITPPKLPDGSDLALGQIIAQREANSMGVYVGNARTGANRPSTFAPQGRPASTGQGTTYSGTIGDDKVDKDDLLGPPSGVKVETMTWREIK